MWQLVPGWFRRRHPRVGIDHFGFDLDERSELLLHPVVRHERGLVDGDSVESTPPRRRQPVFPVLSCKTTRQHTLGTSVRTRDYPKRSIRTERGEVITVVVRGAVLHCAFWVRHGRCRLNSREAEARETTGTRKLVRQSATRFGGSWRGDRRVGGRARGGECPCVWIDPSNV